MSNRLRADLPRRCGVLKGRLASKAGAIREADDFDPVAGGCRWGEGLAADQVVGLRRPDPSIPPPMMAAITLIDRDHHIGRLDNGVRLLTLLQL
jgi:hypothetical protein